MASLTLQDVDTQLADWQARLHHAETIGSYTTADMCRDRLDSWLDTRLRLTSTQVNLTCSS